MKQSRMFVELCLKKNGQPFYTGRIRFRSRVGLLVEASKNSNPMRLILNASEYPVSLTKSSCLIYFILSTA